jgi:hypothetical protein
MSVDAPAAAEVAVIDMERIWSAQAWPYLEQAFQRYPEYCRSSWYSRQSGRIVGFSDKVILQA